MLSYAFDLLYAIYEEEGYAPSEIPALILANNLFGTEIDSRAGSLAAFALTMKARACSRTFFSKRALPNICVLEAISFAPQEIEALLTAHGDRIEEIAFWNQFERADILGSLVEPNPEITARLESHLRTISAQDDLLFSDVCSRAERVLTQAGYLCPSYSVAIANPPYMGNRNLCPQLADHAKQYFPESKSDLFAIFIERCLRLCKPFGSVAMITMQSWMFLSAYKKIRLQILNENRILSMLHLGTNAFDSIGGEVVSTTAFVLGVEAVDNSPGKYIDLREGRSESEKVTALAHAIASGLAYNVTASQLAAIDGQPIAYWLPPAVRSSFTRFPPLGSRLKTAVGLNTGDNDRFLRMWFEVSISRIAFGVSTMSGARESGKKWFPYNKGGGHRKWYGNHFHVINWQNDGEELKDFATYRNAGRHWSRYIQNLEAMLKECITWSDITTQTFAARFSPEGFLFDVKGSSGIPVDRDELTAILSLMCSSLMPQFMKALNPTATFQVGDLARVPFASIPVQPDPLALLPVVVSKEDWDAYERSWNFQASPLINRDAHIHALSEHLKEFHSRWDNKTESLQGWETNSNSNFGERYEIAESTTVPRQEITLTANPDYRFGRVDDADERASMRRREDIADLVSYFAGCAFGRYSLDAPGLILADQGATLADYLAKVSAPTFMPDADNVIPIVDGDWFEDDIVTRFRNFLRVAFGEKHFEENLRFVTEALGVKDLRDYFVKSFYKDHVQRYKKRPIYWLFASPKGSFNALIYMHRYTPSTVSTVLNEYLREFKAKLEATLGQQERLAAGERTPRQQAAAQKEADRIRKMLLELDEYEHDVLYPLASQQIEIDLDDGVKVNYPKFGTALKKIPGLEAAE